MRSAGSTGVRGPVAARVGGRTVGGKGVDSRVVSGSRVSTHYIFTYVVVLLSCVRKCVKKKV